MRRESGVINANDPFNFSDVLSRTPTYPARSLIDPALDRADSAAGNNSTGDRTQPNNTQSDSRQPQSAQDSSGGASPASSASQMACSNGDCVQRLATVKIITDLATSFGKGKDCNQVELGGQAVCQKCGASFAGTLKRTNRASR